MKLFESRLSFVKVFGIKLEEIAFCECRGSEQKKKVDARLYTAKFQKG